MNEPTQNHVAGKQDWSGHQLTGKRQHALVTDIFTQSSLSGVPPRALQIYQRNLQMTAARSLTITYPVLQQMVGEQAMFILAQRLLAWAKPTTGDWAEWGGQLPSLIASSELAADHPYLAGVAQLEWAVHEAGRSRVSAFNRASLSLLTDEDPNQIVLSLQPSLVVLESAYPVQPLWQLHRQTANPDSLSTEALESIMQNRQPAHYAVVYQHRNKPNAEAIDEQAFGWLQGVQQGMSLSALLDAYPGIDFAQWLAHAIEHEWINTILSQR